MQPFHRFRLICTFYRSFAVASLLVTFICTFLFWKYRFAALAGLFWCKAFTMAAIYFFINEYKQREYYYYHNLGLSKKQLWIATLLLDFAFFLLLLITIHHLQ